MSRAQTEQVFGLGMALGVVLGFTLGSFLALLFGEEALSAVQRLASRLGGRDDQVNFELLIQ